MKRGFILLVILLFTLFLIPLVFSVNINSCQTLSANTVYTLTQDVNTTVDCFDFSGDNVVLNCQGFNATGDGGSFDDGVIISNKNNITVKNCKLDNFYEGLYVLSSARNIVLNNNTVLNSVADAVNVVTATNVTITNNIFLGTDTAWLSFYRLTNGNFSYNFANNLRVVWTEEVNTSIFNRNNFTDFSTDVFDIRGTSSSNGNNFTNNLINSSLSYSTTGVPTTAAFNLRNSFNNRIINNTINQSNQAGIIFSGSVNDTLQSNFIINHSKVGIYISGGSENNISFNTIILHTRGLASGIYLKNMPNITTLFNNDLQNNTYGIYLTSSNLTNITNNRINFNSLGLFLNNSFNTTIISNNLTNNLLYGLLLNKSSNNNFINLNSMYNNSYGVYLVNSSNNTLSSNIIFNNTQGGIYLSGSTSTGNSIFSNSIYNHTAGFGSGIYLNGLSLINHIYNNLYLENNTYGIYLNTTNSTNITTNVVRGNTLAGISLYNSFNTTITSINLTSNALYGLLLNQSSNNNLLFTKVENSSYGFYLSTSNNNLLTNLTSYNTSIGFSFYSSQGNNLSGNNVTLSSDTAYLFNNSNGTLTGDNYATNLLNNATVMNISEGSVVSALTNTVLSTDYLNFSFLNATSVSLRTTNNTSAEGVGITTCTSSSKTCLLSSNLLMITNFSSTSSLYNLTLYYNASLLSGYSASELTVASYHNGWASLGTVEINTALAYVRLLGNLNSFSPFGAVVFRDIPVSSSSSSSSSSSGGSGPGPSLDTTTETSSSTTSTKTVLGGSAGETRTLTALLGTDRLELGFTFYKDYHRPLSFGFTRITDPSSVSGTGKEIVLETLEEIKDKKGKFKLYKVDVDKKLKEEVLCKEGQEGMKLRFEIPLLDLGLTEAEVSSIDASIIRVDDAGTRSSLDTKTTFLHGKLIITASLPCLSYFIVSVTPQQRITSFLASFPKIAFGSLKESVRENYLLFLLLFSIIFLTLLGGYFIQKLKFKYNW